MKDERMPLLEVENLKMTFKSGKRGNSLCFLITASRGFCRAHYVMSAASVTNRKETNLVTELQIFKRSTTAAKIVVVKVSAYHKYS